MLRNRAWRDVLVWLRGQKVLLLREIWRKGAEVPSMGPPVH